LAKLPSDSSRTGVFCFVSPLCSYWLMPISQFSLGCRLPSLHFVPFRHFVGLRPPHRFRSLAPYFLFTGKESMQRKAECRGTPLSCLDRFIFYKSDSSRTGVFCFVYSLCFITFLFTRKESMQRKADCRAAPLSCLDRSGSRAALDRGHCPIPPGTKIHRPAIRLLPFTTVKSVKLPLM